MPKQQSMSRRSAITALLNAAGAACYAETAQGQEPAPADSHDMAQLVREAVFPLPPPQQASMFRLAVRFTPSFHPEAYLVVDGSPRSGPVLRLSRAASSINAQIKPAMRRGADFSVEKAVQALNIQTREVRLSQQGLARLLHQFVQALRASMPPSAAAITQALRTKTVPVTLDGTQYEIYYEALQWESSLSFQDDEMIDRVTGQLPLARWANQTRLRWGKD